MTSPSIRSGQLRHKGAIQQATETRDAVGGVVRSWADVVPAWWAQVRPITAREMLSGAQITQEVTHIIRGRVVPGVTITPSMRFVWNGRTFNFVGVINSQERDIMLEITAMEDVSG